MPTQRSNFGQKAGPAGRRGAARLRLALPGKVVLISGHEPCHVDDLSQTGACVALERIAPTIGSNVVLMVQGVEAFGSVIWRRGSSFGVLFDEPIAKDDLVRLRSVHDHFQALEHEENLRRARLFVKGQRFS